MAQVSTVAQNERKGEVLIPRLYLRDYVHIRILELRASDCVRENAIYVKVCMHESTHVGMGSVWRVCAHQRACVSVRI